MDSAIEITTLLDELKSLKSGNYQVNSNVAESKPNYSIQTRPNPIPENEVSMANDEYLPKEAIKKSVVEKLIEKSTTAVKSSEIPKGKLEFITKEDLQEGWNEFLSRYATGDTGLLTLHQEDIIQPKFFNGEVVIQVKNKFFAEKLNDIKSTFHDLLLKHFGAEVGIKILVDDVQSSNSELEEKTTSKNKTDSGNTTNLKNKSSHKENKPHSSNEKSKQDSNIENKHPVEKAIIDLLGAKEITTNNI
jgi:hypothetical protein